MDTSSNQTTARPAPRSMKAAVLLTLIMAGVGHVYCGRLIAGLAWATASVIFSLLVLFGLAAQVSDADVLLLSLPAMLVTLGSLVHVTVVCRRCGERYTLKQCNHWAVYVMLLVFGTAGVTGAAMQLRNNYAWAYVIPTRSMTPTLWRGDRFLVNKRAYREVGPAVGDVIAFRNPMDPKVAFVKRVVATAGQTVEVKQGQLIVDGQPVAQHATKGLDMPRWFDGMTMRVVREQMGDRAWYVVRSDSGNDAPADYPPTEVPNHCVFVLGDNRDRSNDSRAFGPVPWSGVIGKATVVYWPARSWGRDLH